MKKKIMCLFAAMCVLASFAPALINGAEGAEDIEIGDYIQMGIYYGEPILWRCVDIDENGPLMLSDKIICAKPFDAKTSENSTSGSHSRTGNDIDYDFRANWGSNCWADSNIRSWLNSEASVGNVQWLCGNPPGKYYVQNGYNAYNNEAGFLYNFSQLEKNAIKEVTQKSIVSRAESDNNLYTIGNEMYTLNITVFIPDIISNYDNAYAELVTDKMFLLDVKQIHTIYNNRSVLGEYYYQGEITQRLVENLNYTNPNLSVEKRWGYWLRTPDAGSSTLVLYVDSVGIVSRHDAWDAYNGDTYGKSMGIRPAFYLDTDAFDIKSGNGTASKPYSLKEEVISTPTDKPTEEPSEGYPYEITGISLKSNTGADLAAIPGNTGFVAAISIDKKKARENKDYVVVAMYGEGNTLIGVNYIYAEFAENYDYEFGINIPKQSEKIKSIKAYIWDSFDNIQPLCDSRGYE